MEIDALIGLLVTLGAILAVVGLYAWSCRIINRIHSKQLTSLREIKREISNGG